MEPENHNQRPDADPDLSADSWVIKRERGLTEEEEQLLDEQTNADRALSDEIEESGKTWEFIKSHASQLPADLMDDSLVSTPWYLPLWRVAGIAAALLIGVSFLLWGLGVFNAKEGSAVPVTTIADVPKTERLTDGSVVRINAGSDLQYDFRDDMRVVRLIKGEAHFTVTEDPDRPFVVSTGRVQVKAVGTAFNIKLDDSKIDVFVTDGVVEVVAEESETNLEPNSDSVAVPIQESMGYIRFGQRAEIEYVSSDEDLKMSVNPTNEMELKDALGWRESLLSFSGATLEDIAREFERKTGVRIIIRDSELNQVQVGGNFPSDDPYGFLNILQNNYGVNWTQAGDNTVILSLNP